MEAFSVFGQLWDTFGKIGDVLYYVWFAIIPPPLYWIVKYIWMDYKNGTVLATGPYSILEIVPPRDVEKSPLSMELILSAVQGVYTTPSVYEQYALGKVTLPFSFEIAGTDGAAHFYVRCPTAFRGLFESHFYAQYPTAEIVDVPVDYTDTVPLIIPNKDWDLWGADLELVAPDPVPIKTWPNFEEDVTGKMIDPLAGLLEIMGRARPGEHVWLQILAIAQKETWYNTGKAYADELKGRAKKPEKGIIGKLAMMLTSSLAKEGEGAKKDEAPLEFRLSATEKKILQAIEENIGRYVFQVKMRFVYIAPRSIFNKGDMVSGFFGAMKQFADFNLNSLKPSEQSKTKANYLFRKSRMAFKQRLILDRYRRRKMTGVKFFMSDRELATVYHMPDMSVVAPALARTTSTQGSAPINLPIRPLQKVSYSE